MAYQPIKIIAEEQTTDGHVNRETSFDSTPQSNKINYQTGLPLITATPKSLGGKGPRRVDMNGLFYLFSSNLFELQQGNFPTYNSAIVGTGKPLPDGYPLGAVLWYAAGGYFVKSLVANNTESDLSDTTKWEELTTGKANTDFSNVVAAGKATAVGWGMPDYSAAASRTVGIEYTAQTNGWLELYGGGGGNGGNGADGGAKITINGVEKYYNYTLGEAKTWTRSFYPISAGMTYKGSIFGTNLLLQMTWNPCIGG